jgi:hypothetical protein
MVPATQSEMELEEQSNIVTSDEFAMNGYSFGAVVFNHNYNVSGSVNAVNSAGTTTIDISTKSSDLQSVGVIGRYAILPIDKVGTDINMTIGTSANHNAANISSVTTIKFELNLGYTTSFSAASFYFLGGVCYEVIKGTDIEKIITSAGSGFQIGAGISLSNALKIEFLLAQTRHTLNDNYINEIKTQLLTQGFTSATTGSTSNTATSNILSSRLVYTY